MDLPDSRLNSLYKDFRLSKELNPDGYLANISTWRSYLTDKYFINRDKLIFHCGTDFLRELNKDIYGVPKSIDVVINHLVEEGYLVTLEDFDNNSIYSRKGKSLFNWLRSSIFNRKCFDCRRNESTDSYLQEVDLVVIPLVENKFKDIKENIAKNIISNAVGIVDLVFPESEFFKEAGFDAYLNTEGDDYNVMLTYLTLYKEIIIRHDGFIKVIAERMYVLLKENFKDFTENDTRVASLKKSLITVDKQILMFQKELDLYSALLIKSIENKSTRELQKEYLLAKKLTQKYLTKLYSYQNKLRTIKYEVNLASTNETIVVSLNDSKELLKSINDSVGSIDKVHDILDEIKEQSIRTEEISGLLAKGEQDENIDIEIEQELQDMVDKQDARVEASINGERKDNVLDKLKKLEIVDAEPQKSETMAKRPDSESGLTTNQPIAEV